MMLIKAFLIGGLICMIGQLIMDKLKLQPIILTCSLVVVGGALDVFNIYDALIDFAGAGASVPITSFGHSLLHAALEKAEEVGYIGILLGMFSLSTMGITTSIIFSFVFSLIFRPRG